MKRRSRDIVVLALGLAVVFGVGLAGYAAVRARAGGSGESQSLAPLSPPSPRPSQTAAPEYQRWTVGKATGELVVRRRAGASAPILTQLGKYTANGYPTLVLVRSMREVKGTMWYRCYVAIRPNESSGWIREGSLAFYTTSAKIVIDLSRRRLMVYRLGELKGTYPVAVGQPGLETPTGTYFVNQKLRSPDPGGPYGVLALGTSAFQPKLSYWPQGGPVGIHGTNEPWLIGKAVSHGCVRMLNKDILQVGKLVPAGSPIVIQK